MKLQLLVGILLQSAFKSNIIKYWDYVYGIILIVEVGFFIYWGAEIAPLMKENAKAGKTQMMVFGMTAAFVFGITYFLDDILAMSNINVAK